MTSVLKTEVLKGIVGSNPTANVILRNGGNTNMNINQNPNFGTHNTSVRPGKIEYIVIHYVGATGDAKANVNYYNQRTTTNASADFFVGFAGDVWQYNPDPIARYCWAVGGSKLSNGGATLYGIAKNTNCVSIEMCVRNKGSQADTSKDWYFEDATVTSAIELTKYLMNLYGIPAAHVIRHYDVTGKICPNPYAYNNTQHTWAAFKAALIGTGVKKSSGWIQVSDGWMYYNGDTGLPVCNNWVQVDGKWYWFDGAGIMVTNTWYQYNQSWYYLGPDGAMCTSQLVANSGKIYAVDADGKMVTGEILVSALSDGALVYKGLLK